MKRMQADGKVVIVSTQPFFDSIGKPQHRNIWHEDIFADNPPFKLVLGTIALPGRSWPSDGRNYGYACNSDEVRGPIENAINFGFSYAYHGTWGGRCFNQFLRNSYNFIREV